MVVRRSNFESTAYLTQLSVSSIPSLAAVGFAAKPPIESGALNGGARRASGPRVGYTPTFARISSICFIRSASRSIIVVK